MLTKLHGNPWAVLATVCPGIFIVLLDLTIVNIAIPGINDDLGASLDQILWVISAYTLALATLIITAGRLGDLRGKRNLYMGGLTIFVLASLACGLAQDPTQLIILRAFQGVGAAMLLPQTLSLIADTFPPGKRGLALGIWAAVGGLSGVAGPTVGGLLITDFSWRWIFFVNVPVGVLGLLMAMAFLPKQARTEKRRLDIPGVLLASAGLFCLAFALIQGERYSWNGWIWTMLVAAAVLLAVFLMYERSQQNNEPLLPFSPFKDRNFSLVNVVGVVASFGVIGLLLPVVIYMQSVLEFSAFKAGLVLLALAFGGLVSAAPGGVISEKFGSKYVLMSGLLAFSGGLVWYALAADVDASWTASIGPLFLAGAGAGATFTPMASEVVRNVPASLNGAASGVHNSLRQVGSVLAGAVIGAVLQVRLASALAEEATKSAQALPVEYRDGFIKGFADAGSQGLNVGTDQAASGPAPQGVPADVAQTLQAMAGQVFGNGFVDAMRPTMLVSAAAMLLGALICLGLRGGVNRTVDMHGFPIVKQEPEQEPAILERVPADS